MILRSPPARFLVCLSVLLMAVSLCELCTWAQDRTTYKVLPNETIEGRLLQSSDKNPTRQTTLERMFQDAGCNGPSLTEQPIKIGKDANVICSLAGASDAVIIVGAHFDHVNAGDGVADNWSGAALLPSLFQSLQGTPRKHAFVFIGFADEERGLLGSAYYVKALSKGQVAGTHAMINLDTLGLGPTKVWLTHSDKHLADQLNVVAASMNEPLAVMNADKVGDEDSTSFRKRRIPTLMVHSITQDTLPILHTANDTVQRIDVGAYYDTYRLLARFLAVLDADLE